MQLLPCVDGLMINHETLLPNSFLPFYNYLASALPWTQQLTDENILVGMNRPKVFITTTNTH